ncbi:MAG: bifunctional UDP-N-acetylglucosamine diphosphorylase/glucosamine-1-phosphate N-acetyltransferase GlmU [Elusimicrobia bacterium]|nr:bifunctional UDP-N-acetylglucosamine diphosphorylase/glucosamine-1-phosphate N-acetyltransferase GlmU [Elusimicrobiota bacterium]
MKDTNVIILAAGEGTRFKSDTPKVLHKISGKTIVERVIDTVINDFGETIVVVGYRSAEVKKAITESGKYKNIVFVEQKRQLGSGDAVKQAEKKLKNFNGNVIVISGDIPLLKKETIGKLLDIHEKEKAVCTVLTCEFENPENYGRIVRNGGIVKSIIEEKDANAEIKKIKEINTGIYVFSAQELFKALKKIKSDNAKGEYYLTDVVLVFSSQNKKIVACKTNSAEEIIGINNRYELSKAENILRKNILKNLMFSGVSISDPETTYIDETVVIEKDATILPSTIIKGKTKIESGCVIGPFSYIENSLVGRNVEIKASFVYGAEISKDVKIGPFSHIRPESKIGPKARIGNFSEIKKSSIGENTKVSHLSYIGDSQLGKDINIGAGTITCNYDGKLKHKTEIGDGSFIGSNTNFVAPVKIGKGVLVAAGSTITEDVPDKMLAIARERQIIKRRRK